MAPWPVGNKELAKKYLGEAAALAPTRRNLYYVGVNAYQMQEYTKAKTYFGKALKAGCASRSPSHASSPQSPHLLHYLVPITCFIFNQMWLADRGRLWRLAAREVERGA